MADDLREFLVSIGFAADASEAAKAEAAVKKVEAGITATTAAESAKRVEGEKDASDARVTIAEMLGRMLSLEEQKYTDVKEKARKVDTERDEKRQQDRVRKERSAARRR